MKRNNKNTKLQIKLQIKSKMDNNTIIVENIDECTRQEIDGHLIINRIVRYVNERQLFEKNLRGSIIEECKINKNKHDIKKYKKILTHIYSNTNTETIMQNTILNISQQEIYEKGFEYYPKLGMSIQGTDARRTLKEIINIIKIKNDSIELKIKLKNDEIIRFII